MAGSSTCPWMGLMIAYNQFGNATDTSLSPNVTYTGRQTASKIVILETDGCPNTECSGYAYRQRSGRQLLLRHRFGEH